MEEAVEDFVSVNDRASSFQGGRKKEAEDAFGLDEAEGVFDLQMAASDSDDEGSDVDEEASESEDSQEDDDSDVDIRVTGRAGRLPRGRPSRGGTSDGSGAALDSGSSAASGESGESSEDDEGDEIGGSDDSSAGEEDEEPGEDPNSGWGRRKSVFYNGDTADLEIGQDFEDAEDEEEAAREQQKTMYTSLADSDFFGDFLGEAPDGGKARKRSSKAAPDEVQVDRVDRDLSKLSKKEKLQILLSQSPELLLLLGEARERLQELDAVSTPLCSLLEAHAPTEGGEDLLEDCSSEGRKWIRSKQLALFGYLTNLVYYLALKASVAEDHAAIKEHPVIGRLLRYREVLEDFGEIDAMLRPQVRRLLRDIEDAGAGRSRRKRRRAIPADAAAATGAAAEEAAAVPTEDDFFALIAAEKKRQKEAKKEKYKVVKKRREETVKEGEKRGITYQIMKNRGLQPHKNKINRNPRVKKREQYRKALLRRKGMVREVRDAEHQYGGEQSGINAAVKRSRRVGRS